MKNLRQNTSYFGSSFVDVLPKRENESPKMLNIFYRTASYRSCRVVKALANFVIRSEVVTGFAPRAAPMPPIFRAVFRARGYIPAQELIQISPLARRIR